jgi:hypothetical protein
MRCISLWQPWATLVVIGAKEFETRGWPTSYRGPLAIHAAKKWGPEFEAILRTEPFRTVLHGHDLPKGAIVGTVELVGCFPTEAVLMPDGQERAFGNYGPGRYAWKLANPVDFLVPIAYRGQQGFFDVPLPEVDG